MGNKGAIYADGRVCALGICGVGKVQGGDDAAGGIRNCWTGHEWL